MTQFEGVRAVFLDIDGTVLDTREFIYQAAEHALARNGYPPVSREQIRKAVGRSFGEFYTVILERDDIDVLPLQTSHRMFQLERLDLSMPYPGAVETLTELKQRGYSLAAITNRGRSTLMPTLEHAGIAELFDVVMSADDAPELKPSPKPLLLALDRLRLVPEEAVMIGDTDIDILAGKTAGVRTIRVWYGFIGDRVTEVPADHSIEKSITELLPLFP